MTPNATATPSTIETIIELFLRRIEQSGDRTAIHWKQDGRFQSQPWRVVAEDVFRLAAVLAELGARATTRVAHWSENRYEWVVTDLACQACQAIHVPLHAPLSGSQAVYQIRHSGAQIVLLSGATQLDKLKPHLRELDDEMVLLTHDPLETQLGDRSVASWRARVSDDAVTSGAHLAARARETTSPDAVATILYTSGTTGEPKGVTLTQWNICTNVVAALEAFDETASDVRLCLLPLSHIYARTCDLYTWIGSGSQLALAESRETVVADCQAIRPTIINAVPYFWEKLQNALTESGNANTPGALCQMLGGNVRTCCSGGAALPVHTFDFFQTQGLPILQGYGLTETAPILTMSTGQQSKRGTVGRALPDVDIRIADDGEILARGPNIMLGYWNDKPATDAAIVDGWFHTGDLGSMDEDGFLTITGRKKELIVTATGKNIAPSLVESMLCRDPLIEQAMVLGDDQKYLAALIVPQADNLAAELEKRGLPAVASGALGAHPDVQEIYQACVTSQLTDLSQHEQVRRFVLLDRGFTIEDGHLTPKASLRRDRIAEDFAAEIARLFAL